MNERLQDHIVAIAALVDKNEEPSSEQYAFFSDDPAVALDLVEVLNAIEERTLDDARSYYSACIFAMDVCVAQLQIASERKDKVAQKILDQLMSHLATVIASQAHTLSFWLPILNAFYEVHVELSDTLKKAYLDLACDEGELTPEEEEAHLGSIRDLIHELSDLSIFDIAENFFAQSYAMPADFFVDLVMDLYSIEEGHDIALLTLLHPKLEVRDTVVATLEQLMDTIELSPASLSRLQIIKNWYPASYHAQFDRWIKQQRRKGAVYRTENNVSLVLEIKASEVDGSGAQGIFIDIKQQRQHRLCGLLFKQGIGIKDAWVTPFISRKDVSSYYHEAFDDSVLLRDVDESYLSMMVEHFLAMMIQQGRVPDLHLLEIQEILSIQWHPKPLDVDYLIEQLSIQISPFTPDSMQASLKRSKTWPNNKRFTESWYVEDAAIDKHVNRCCHFEDGVKVCRFNEAIEAVFKKEFEPQRQYWCFHFLWVALWLKAKTRKNEKVWQDAFMVAYAIHTGGALEDIPIMREICHHSVVNSIETMQERRTHLNRQ